MKTFTDEKTGQKYFLVPVEKFGGCENWEDLLDLQIAKFISKNGDFIEVENV